ncbi:MAG: TlpA disulfide reductase family protein [Bdellovibrionales bacterium]
MKSAYIKPLLIFIPIILVILGSYFYFQSNKNIKSEKSQIEAKRILDLGNRQLIDLKGKTVNLPGTSRVTIIHFWASWCGPCVEEFPQLVSLANNSDGKIQVIAISGDSDRNEIDVFLKSFPEAINAKDFHIIWDEKKDLVKEWSVQKLPESYIYDSNKKLAKRISGAVEWLTDDAKAYMRLLTDGKTE